MRDLPFLRRQQFDQLPRRRARQFFEQRRAIVRRHLVQNADDLLVRHGAQQLLLRLDVEVFEHIRGERVGQDAENDDLLVLRHVENHLGHVGRRPFAKNFPERAEITRVDQALNFG